MSFITHYSSSPTESSIIARIDMTNHTLTNGVTQLSKWLDTLNFFDNGMSKYGNTISRSQLWFHEQGNYFSSDWKTRTHDRWTSQPYLDSIDNITNEFDNVQNKFLSQCTAKGIDLEYTRFNSCQINKYANSKQCIAAHSDNQSDFGADPTIMIWSLGAKRRMIFRRLYHNINKPQSRKIDMSFEPIVVDLLPNTVLVMAGTTQKYFQHEIPTEEYDCGLRYSLTFRAHNTTSLQHVH